MKKQMLLFYQFREAQLLLLLIQIKNIDFKDIKYTNYVMKQLHKQI